jgi:hypothetical protein
VGQLVITSTDAQLERARDFLAAIPGAAEVAMSRALNHAANAGRETAIDGIVGRYAVQSGDVRERVTLSAATPGNLSMSVVARSGPLALGYFPHTPTQLGTGGRGRPVLRAEVIRGQEKEVPGAFIAPINGKNRIMIRTGEKRLPIKSLSTVPIGSMLGAKTVREAVEEKAIAVVDQYLDKEIDRALGK